MVQKTPEKQNNEEVVIKGKQVCATSPEGQRACIDLERFIQVVVRLLGQAPQGDCILPDGVKLEKTRGPITVWVYERPPQVYSLKWIAGDSPAPFGKETKYRTVRIALPYLLVLAVFERGAGDHLMLSHRNECFFLNAPLKSPQDKLFYPALLNCSKFEPQEGHPLSWICTAKLDVRSLALEKDHNRRMRESLRALLHCLLETGYNQSSEHNEESSWFTESTGVDPRVSTVEKWERATAKDPLFVLDVPWLETGFSLDGVIERIFQNVGLTSGKVCTAEDVKRIVFNNHSRRRMRKGPHMPLFDFEE